MTSIRSVLAGQGIGEVEYDEAFHVYRVGGDVWPSVTQVFDILNDFDDIPAEILKAAGDRGRRVHSLIQSINEGKPVALDADNPEHGYVQQWLRFMAMTKPEILDVEAVICNRSLRYCGRFDLVARINKQVTMIDVKTCALFPRSVGPQTAGYSAGYQGAEKIKRRMVVLLKPTSYEAVLLKDPRDMSIFISALNCWRYRYDPSYRV
jgi:hypothetical protein